MKGKCKFLKLVMCVLFYDCGVGLFKIGRGSYTGLRDILLLQFQLTLNTLPPHLINSYRPR